MDNCVKLNQFLRESGKRRENVAVEYENIEFLNQIDSPFTSPFVYCAHILLILC